MTIRFDALCRIAEEVRFDPATEDLSKFFLPPTPSPELPIPLSSDDLDPAGPPFPSSPLPLPPSPFSLENSDTESDSNLGELPFPSSPLPPPPSPFSPEASAAESDSSYSDVPAASGRARRLSPSRKAVHQRQWYRRKKIKEYQSAYRKTHSKKNVEYQRKYRKTYPEKFQARRQALKTEIAAHRRIYNADPEHRERNQKYCQWYGKTHQPQEKERWRKWRARKRVALKQSEAKSASETVKT